MTRDLGPRLSDGGSVAEEMVEDDDRVTKENWVELGGGISLGTVDTSDTLRLDSAGVDVSCSCGGSAYASSEGFTDGLRFFRGGDARLGTTAGLSSRRRRLGTYPVWERVRGLRN